MLALMKMSFPRSLLLMAGTVFVLTAVTPKASAFFPNSNPANTRQNEPAGLIVKLQSEFDLNQQRTGAPGGGAADIFRTFGNPAARPLLPEAATGLGKVAPGTEHPAARIFVLTFPDTIALDLMKEHLEAEPWVEYVEYDRLMTLHQAPNDPLYTYQWGLQNTGQTIPVVTRIPGEENDTLAWVPAVPGNDINFPVVHEYGGPRSPVVVGVIDTGSDLIHEDLQGHLWRNPGEIEDNGLDDDHNGFVDDYYGYDFSGDEFALPNELIPDPDPTDPLGHGTHVAGIISGVTDNALGIAGVAADARIMTIKVFPAAFNSVVAQSIYYATDNGAQVLNMSFGSPYPSKTVSDAIAYAHSRRVLSISSTGNDGVETYNFPAADSLTLGIGAFSYDGALAWFSTIGDFVDLVAPGEAILSLRAAGTDLYADGGEPGVHIVEEDYLIASGTSMSAPHAVGCAAVVMAFESGLSPDEIGALLKSACVDLVDPYLEGDSYPGWDKFTGHGLIDLNQVINQLAGITLSIETPHEGDLVSGTVEITGTAAGPAFSAFQLDYGSSIDPATWTTIATGNTAIENDILSLWSTGTSNGTYTLRLSSPSGHEDRVTITVGNLPNTEIISPIDGDSLAIIANIEGTSVAPDYRSSRFTVFPEIASDDTTVIWTGTRPVVDDSLLTWTIDPATSGWYYLKLTTEYDSGTKSDSVRVFIDNPYHLGWPVYIPSYAFYTPIMANLNPKFDQTMEVIIPSSNGLYVFEENGELTPGWPRNLADNFQSVPSVVDLDNDQLNDIVIASGNFMHALTYFGEPFANWPREFTGGGEIYGVAVPQVCDLHNNYDVTGEPYVLSIDAGGVVRAFDAYANAYSWQTGHLIVDVFHTNKAAVPKASVVDLGSYFGGTPDGDNELVVAADGLWVFNAVTGHPYNTTEAQIRDYESTHGMAIGNFDDDKQREIAICYLPNDSDEWHIEVLKADGTTLAGWPVNTGLSRDDLIMNPLAAGDVDGDQLPEIFVTAYFLSDAIVKAYHADGTSLLPENPDGTFLHIGGSCSAVSLTDITGDGDPEIILKAGQFFYGNEYLYALSPAGALLPGYPLRIGFGMGNQLAAPITADINANDSLNILTLESTGQQITTWDFPIEYQNRGHPWPRFRRDNWNSGILPMRPRYSPIYVIKMVNFMYRGQAFYFAPYIDHDANCDGDIGVIDLVFVVNHVFRGRALPCQP